MTRRTILFTESGTFGGGSFQSLCQLLECLDRGRFEPLVAFVNPTSFLDRLRELEVETFLFTDPVYSLAVHRRIRKRLEHLEEGTFRRLPALGPAVHRLCHGPLIRSLVRLVRGRGVELLYLNDQIDRDFFGLEVARRTGVPCISHLRSMNGEPFTPGKAVLANRGVRAFVARAGVVRDYWVRRGLDPALVKVIPNGIEIRDLPPANLAAEFGLAPGTAVLGCVGRIIPEKGHLFLVDSFARLRHTHPRTALVIIGNGPFEQNVRDHVASTGVENVIFAGRRDDAPALMAGMDVLVQPAESDSFGRTVIEAMVAKTPLVCADTGGIREILRHGENGLLVPFDDTQAMARALAELLDDAPLAARLARAGYATALERYDLRARAEEIGGLIERTLTS